MASKISVGFGSYAISWLRINLRNYPYLATSPASILPGDQAGDHCSVCVTPGARTWAFRDASERDRFVDLHPGAEELEALPEWVPPGGEK